MSLLSYFLCLPREQEPVGVPVTMAAVVSGGDALADRVAAILTSGGPINSEAPFVSSTPSSVLRALDSNENFALAYLYDKIRGRCVRGQEGRLYMWVVKLWVV